MKRIILTCITALTVIPLLAQYSGPGFYRIKNRGTAARYISIANDKVSDEAKQISLSSGYNQKIDIEALATIKNAEADPATILYIKGSEENGLILEAQGHNTQSLINSIGKDLRLMSRDGFLYSKYDGMQVYLADEQWEETEKYDNCAKIISNNARTSKDDWGNYPNYVKWSLKKVNNDSEYLGINPSEGIAIDNKYYTTLYTSFAYQLSEGMKAYYIDQHIYDTKHVEEPIAELKEITGGKVPSGTPVIIECSSNNATDNKVTPLDENLAKIQDNELAGRYFCYILFKGRTKTESENETAATLKNALEFDQNKMRVLGIKDGKLAMVSDNDKALKVTTKSNGKGKYIPANKAYLPIKASESSTATNIRLLLPSEYQVAASISKVTVDENNSKAGVYTLTGVKIKEDSNTKGLPNGIYIIDGKKQVIR